MEQLASDPHDSTSQSHAQSIMCAGVTRRASITAYRSMRVGEDDEATFAPASSAVRALEEKRRM